MFSRKYDINELYIAQVGELTRLGKEYRCDGRKLAKTCYIILKCGNYTEGSYGYSIVDGIKFSYFKYIQARVAKNIGNIQIIKEEPLRNYVSQSKMSLKEIKNYEERLNLKAQEYFAKEDPLKLTIEYKRFETLMIKADLIIDDVTRHNFLSDIEKLRSYYFESNEKIEKKCAENNLDDKKLEDLLWDYCSNLLKEIENDINYEILNQDIRKDSSSLERNKFVK